MMSLDLSRWSPTQREAILARGENVLISAGAGSGKTSVLVERVSHCVAGESPTDLRRLLVVTFTEAAAAEMRKRITDRLKGLADAATQQGDAEFAKRLSEQLMQVEQAQISTLHAFCMQIVRRNFLFLGIEPVFTLMGEDEAAVLKSDIMQQLIEGMLAGPDGHALSKVITTFGMRRVPQFTDLVMRLYAFAVSQPDPIKWLQSMAQRFSEAQTLPFAELPWIPAFMGWVERHVAMARSNFEAALQIASQYSELESYRDNLQVLCERCQEVVAAVQQVEGIPLAASLIHAMLSEKSPRAKDGPGKAHAQDKRTNGIGCLKKILPLLDRGTEELKEDILQLKPDVETLVQCVCQFIESYQSAKLSRSWLDFNDLEHFALRVLKDGSSGEARRLQDLYDEIFVDEYQDTSPIQDAIVAQITRPKGNVFVVGDVKQSIYRFRMAEPNLFLNKYNTLGRTLPGKVIDLAANYRSRPQVVHAVNFFFSQLFSMEFGGIVYDHRARMVIGAQYPDSEDSSVGGPVEVHLVSRDGDRQEDGFAESAEADDERLDSEDGDTSLWDDASAIEKEALVIGRRIQQLMGHNDEQAKKQVWDAKAGGYRPLQYRDIVILLRSVKGRMNTILEVFRKLGIPSYGATSTGFYGALEVQWLLAALSAVDNPRRDRDFVTLLRSPMVRFDDEELALIRLAHRGNFYEAWKHALSTVDGSSPGDWPVAPERSRALLEKMSGFHQQFSKWRQLAKRAATETVLRQVLADTDFGNYVLGMAGGDVREANVQILLDKARTFDKTSADGVYGFVNYANAALKQEVDFGEARTLGEHEDVVRIMTIHQSKGLEFPVVFVADLGKMFYRNPQETMFPLHRVLGFGPQCVDADSDQRWPTVASIAIEEWEKREFLSEEARVLYVALTRAKEKLILVGSARKLQDAITKAVEQASGQETCLPSDVLLGAKTYLDWILPALVRHRQGASLVQATDAADVHHRQLDLWTHPSTFDMQFWGVPGDSNEQVIEAPVSKADSSHRIRYETVEDVYRTIRQKAVPTNEPRFEILSVANESWRTVPGKVSATDLRRLWASNNLRVGRTGSPVRGSAAKLLENPSFTSESTTSGRESGVAFHEVMRYIDFLTTPTPDEVQRAIQHLVKERKVSPEVADAVAVDDVIGFLSSPIGRQLSQASNVYREQPFFRRIDLPFGTGSRSLYSVVQGVIDCLAEVDDEWILVDYKTDNIRMEDAAAKSQEYAAQVAVYLDAARDLGITKPIRAYLYFVKPKTFVEMDPLDLTRLFELS